MPCGKALLGARSRSPCSCAGSQRLMVVRTLRLLSSADGSLPMTVMVPSSRLLAKARRGVCGCCAEGCVKTGTCWPRPAQMTLSGALGMSLPALFITVIGAPLPTQLTRTTPDFLSSFFVFLLVLVVL